MQPRLNAGSELFSPAVAAVPLPKKQIPALVGVCKDSFAAQIVFGLLCLTAARGSDPLTKKEIPLLQPGSAELFWVPIRGTNETKLDAFISCGCGLLGMEICFQLVRGVGFFCVFL